MYDMRKTITIRTDRRMREALERRAEESGSSMSEVVRSILEEALVDRPLEERVGHLRGAIALDASDVGWRDRLRERNWRG